jgi:Fic family protein
MPVTTSSREYQQSHPWLSFRVDLRNVPVELWLLLGESKSKCEHIAETPLRPEVAQELHAVYLAKGAAATTAIEGNSLSEQQVREILEHKLRLPPSQQYLKQEVDNMLTAYKLITRNADRRQLKPLTVELIQTYNKMTLHNLQLDKGVIPGQITHAVTVLGYKGAPRRDCLYLLDRLCAWLNSEELNSPRFHPTINGIIKAVLAHLYLAWIHPFGDGNGRTARLLEFRLLLEAGVPSPAAHLLANHYNLTRNEYYRQLDYSSKSGGDVQRFLLYATQGFLDGLKSQLSRIREQQLDVTWRAVVFQAFKDKTSAPDVRRRVLLWEISQHKEPVSVQQLLFINPAVMHYYTNVSERTLQRDIDVLESMGLVVLSRGRREIRAKRELILGFLPRNTLSAIEWTQTINGLQTEEQPR